MDYEIGHNNYDEGGNWMRTVMELIDLITKHDISNENNVCFFLHSVQPMGIRTLVLTSCMRFKRCKRRKIRSNNCSEPFTSLSIDP